MARIFISGLFLAQVVYGALPTGRYKAIVDQMNTLQAKYSNIASIHSIGQNGEGTEIYAMRVSLTPQVVDHHKVGHLVVSTHHGNELAAPQFTMAFLGDLLSRYQTDERFQTSLTDTEWTIIPVLNVSGYNNNQREEYGRDPNRDYPSPCTAHPGGTIKSIGRLLDFMKSRVFSGTVTVHGYVGVLAYPWGMFTSNTETLDHNTFQAAFQKAAIFNGYRVGTSADAIYPANGTYEDYVYWKYGMWSLLLELESGSATDISTTVKAIGAFFDQLNASPSAKNQFLGSCTRIEKDLKLD